MLKISYIIIIFLIFATSANATFIDRGGGMIYDDDLKITWLQDARYAITSGYNADGVMSWYDANNWANNLSYGGFDDWRLPTALNPDGSGPCVGYNCTGSEMGYLFYNELGGTAGSSFRESGDPDLALFNHLQVSDYWSSTEYAPDPTLAWFISPALGQGATFKWGELYAMAVRDGDVIPPPPSSVPEPSTILLLSSGLIGLIGLRKKILNSI